MGGLHNSVPWFQALVPGWRPHMAGCRTLDGIPKAQKALKSERDPHAVPRRSSTSRWYMSESLNSQYLSEDPL